MACSGGHINIIIDLIDRQANLHQRCRFGTDALMLASYYGHVNVIKLLLSHGADMNAKANDGITALSLAAWNDKFSACNFLISKGSDLMIKNNHGKTALDLYGNNESINPSLSEDEKKKKCEELFATFSLGPHPSQVLRRRDANWSRRWHMMNVATGCGFRPLTGRLIELELQRIALEERGESPPYTALDIPEQRRVYFMGQIFSNEGLLRLIIGCL